MDDKDRLLIDLLRRDARRSIVALARDIGLSRSATQDRLAKLQASGAIAGFTVIEGVSSGARQLAYLFVKLQPGSRCATILPSLRNVATISAAHSVAGAVDLILTIEGVDVADLERARHAVTTIDGVAEVFTHVVLERHIH